MFHLLVEKEGGPAAQTLPLSKLTHDDSHLDELREHVYRLRLILPIISVSAMALRRQEEESDSDIARVLRQFACEPLDSEIERIECILASHTCRLRQQEACT